MCSGKTTTTVTTITTTVPRHPNAVAAADRTAASVAVNPTPVAGRVPPVKKRSSTCSGGTTLAARVGVCGCDWAPPPPAAAPPSRSAVSSQGASATWEVPKVRRAGAGTVAAAAGPTWRDPSATCECGDSRGDCSVGLSSEPRPSGLLLTRWLAVRCTYRWVSTISVRRPRRDHYFPDLHHLKFEIEEGTTADGRPVRFGYSPLEFPGFSWRGYAQMSSIQVGPP